MTLIVENARLAKITNLLLKQTNNILNVLPVENFNIIHEQEVYLGRLSHKNSVNVYRSFPN